MQGKLKQNFHIALGGQFPNYKLALLSETIAGVSSSGAY